MTRPVDIPRRGAARIAAGLLVLAGPWVSLAIDAAPRAGTALAGTWGGDRAQLVVEPEGTRLELDCATGYIPGAVPWQPGGRFEVQGTFENHGPGSARANDAERPPAARFRGEIVSGGALRLEVLPEGRAQPQVYVLREWLRVRLARCL